MNSDSIESGSNPVRWLTYPINRNSLNIDVINLWDYSQRLQEQGRTQGQVSSGNYLIQILNFLIVIIFKISYTYLGSPVQYIFQRSITCLTKIFVKYLSFYHFFSPQKNNEYLSNIEAPWISFYGNKSRVSKQKCFRRSEF